jgi:hypothetical protein
MDSKRMLLIPIGSLMVPFFSRFFLQNNKIVDFGKFPDLDPENKFIRSTRIRVARNLDGFGLGSINEEERLAIEKTVADTLKALEGELGGTYYPLDGMEEKTREQLVADHFLFKKGDRFLEAAGITSFWPKGRGLRFFFFFLKKRLNKFCCQKTAKQIQNFLFQ